MHMCACVVCVLVYEIQGIGLENVTAWDRVDDATERRNFKYLLKKKTRRVFVFWNSI